MAESGQIIQTKKIQAKAGDKQSLVQSALAQYTRLNTDQDAGSLFALLGFVNILTGVILLLTAGLGYMVHHGRPPDREYAMSFDGRTMPLTALIDPSLNTNAMLSWVDLATTQIMTFGFNDIEDSFGSSRKYFTDIGWQSFYKALTGSDLLRSMMQNQLIVTAILTAPPRILWKGFRRGDFVWDIQVPIALTIRAGDVSRYVYPRLMITIMRVPTQQNPTGFGIQQWSLS